MRRRFLDLPYDPRLDELEDELDVLEDDLDYMEELLLDLEALWDAYELGLQAAHAFVSIRLGQIKGSLDANAIYALVSGGIAGGNALGDGCPAGCSV